MKIAIVAEHAHPTNPRRTGGQSVHVRALSRELGRAGNDVTVYTARDDSRAPDGCRSPDREELAPRVAVERVRAARKRETRIPALARHLSRQWQGERPDVVHAHFWTSGLAAIAGAKDLDIPVVSTFHDLRRERARLERAIGLESDAVIATSHNEAAEVQRLRVPRPRIRVVPSGVDVEQFSPEGPASPRGIAPRLLYVGRLAERKGTGTLVQALARVPHAELVIAGGPEPSALDDDPDVHRLRQVAEESGVAGRVTFLGRVSHAEVPSLMRSADLVVSVPSRGGFGRVPVEAMACGVPVVTSPVGGHPDSVLDGVTGLHVWPATPAEVGRRIRTLIADSTHREAFGVAAADRAQSRFAWDRIGRETVAVYDKVIAGHT